MQKIINPYNFIPFGTNIEKNKESREDTYRGPEQLHSGWLDVKMIPSTPIIIPDGAHPVYIDPETGIEKNNPNNREKNNLHKKYDFIHYDRADGSKMYYIPGSSIRGVIRSVYEAATDSCVPFLLADAKKPISQRVPLYAALKDRGLLCYEYDKGEKCKIWKLYKASAELEAVTIQEETKRVFDAHQHKEMEVSSYHLMRKDGGEITVPTGKFVKDKGVIQYNIPIDLSKEYHVAYLTKKDLVYSWKKGDDEPYRLLNSVLCRDNVKGNQKNRNEKPAQDLKKALDHAKKGGGMVPVYYFKVVRKHEDYDEELVYLSNSSAGRIAQKRRWADIMGEHGPCKGGKLCPACRMFGALGNNYGLKSHVRVSDALPEKGRKLVPVDKTLDILGEPRTSAFEFYLDHPEGASYWNFDFYGITEKDKNGVGHTHYYDMEKAMPRGRKMYWHGQPQADSAKGKLNATMAAAEETNFIFRVYFDEISDSQLQDLMWTITLGDNRTGSPYQHKIGHGKPLGYGSVKMVITGGAVRKISNTDKGIEVSTDPLKIPENPKGSIDLQAAYVQDLLRMSDIHAAEKVSDQERVPVQYPLGPDGKIYSWFSENRLRADELQELPHPSDEDISLSSETRRQRRNPAGRNNERKTYKKGDRVSGTVDGFNNNRSVMFIKLQNGDKNSKAIYFKNTYKRIPFGELDLYFPEGTEVTLEYKGKDDKDRDQWWVVD